MAGVEDLERRLTAGMPGTKFLADDPNVVTPGQKLNSAVGEFFKNLGATVGPVVSDLGRGVKEIGGIPKTIYEGTQSRAAKKFTGGAEPTVNPALLNLVRGVAEPVIKTNATPKSPVTSPTVPTSGTGGVINIPIDQSLIDRPGRGVETNGNIFSSVNPNAQHLGVEGSRFGSFGSDQEYYDWKARGDKMDAKNPAYLALERERENPNNQLFKDLTKKIVELSEGPVDRSGAMRALGALAATVGGQSSFGNFGVEGMKNEVAKGHLGVAEGALGIKKGTLELAKAKEAREGVETAAKSKYYEANAEESKAKAKYYGDQDKPGKFETQAQQAWLKGYDDYLKSDTVLQDIMGKDPAERAAAVESHKALYRQLNPPAPIRKVDNPDGTVTVTFADGTVRRYRRKKPE